LLAIFLTFASLTLWSDASPATSGFSIPVAAWASLSGLIGVGHAVVGVGYRRLPPVVIAVNFLIGPAMLYRAMPHKGASSLKQAQVLQKRLQVLAFARAATTLLAYCSFVMLLRIEGRRSIGAHTEIRLAREMIHAGLVPR
jgi:hypothetical protein